MMTPPSPRTLGQLVVALCAAPGLAQSSLYSNASAQSGVPALLASATTSAGTPAPPLGAWCEPQKISSIEANGVLGLAVHRMPDGTNRLADDFVVTAGNGWLLNQVRVYAYVTDWVGTASPFASANLRIWNGPPSEPTAQVIWGDTQTNRLVAAVPLNLFRIVEQSIAPVGGPADQRRRIWQIDIQVGDLALPMGEYWLDWQLVSTDPTRPLFAPPATVAGQRTRQAWNALSLATVDGQPAWTPVVDSGKRIGSPDYRQDLPFVLLGTEVPHPCLADFDGDLFLNQEDLSTFLTAFLSEPTSPGPGGFAVPCPGNEPLYQLGYQIDVNRDCDGNQEDLAVFITAFFDGCN